MSDGMEGLSPQARARIEAMASRVRDAEAVLHSLGLQLDFSVDAIATIDAAIAPLQDRSAEAKQEIEVLRQEKRDIKAQVETLLQARAYLHEIRGEQPGDVTAGVGTMFPGGDA